MAVTKIDRMGIVRDADVDEDTLYGSLYRRLLQQNGVNEYGGGDVSDSAKLVNITNAAAGSTCLFHNGTMYIKGFDGEWDVFGGD